MSDIGEETAAATLETAEDRDWGTSSEDIEAYASTAGAVAGAAACSAVGAAAAASLCSALTGWAAGWVAETLTDWFTSSEEAERARARRREVRELANRARQIDSWESLNGQDLDERIAALRDLHSRLWPDDPWVSDAPDVLPGQRQIYPALLLLVSHGLRSEAREGQYLALGLPSLSAEWMQLQGEMSDQVLFERLQAEAVEISESIDRAYDRAVLDLTAQAAGDRTAERAHRPLVRTVSAAREGGIGRRSAFGDVASHELRHVHAHTRRTPFVDPSRSGWKPATWRLVATAGATTLGVFAWRLLRA